MTQSRFFWPVLGSVAVVVLSPVLELVTGEPAAYSFAVLGLLVLFWILSRMPRRRMGLTLGDGETHQMALLYPAVMIGVAAVVVYYSGDTAPESIDGRAYLGQILVMAIVTVIGALLTEDGFFRGWLWGSLEQGEFGEFTTLVWTGLAFSLWHLPVVLIEESFRLPIEQIPVYLTNVYLMGVNWGVLRLASGSVLPAAISHGVWNGLVYVLFGYGTQGGLLGVSQVHLYDPERGWLGVALNGVAFWLLWLWYQSRLEAALDGTDAVARSEAARPDDEPG